MTNFFEKLGLVESTSQPTQAPPVVISTPQEKSTYVAPPPTMVITSDSAIQPYELAFSKINTPQFDLYEFYQSVQKLGSSEQNFRSIFELGKTLNPDLTKEMLLRQCDEQLQQIVGSSKTKIEEYKNLLAQKQEQLKTITQEVASLQNLLSERETGYNLFVQRISDLKTNISRIL